MFPIRSKSSIGCSLLHYEVMRQAAYSAGIFGWVTDMRLLR